MPVRYVERDIRIGVDPYIEIKRQAAVFDVDLSKCRVLPIQAACAESRATSGLGPLYRSKVGFRRWYPISPIDVFTVGSCGSAGAVGEQPSLATPPTQPEHVGARTASWCSSRFSWSSGGSY